MVRDKFIEIMYKLMISILIVISIMVLGFIFKNISTTEVQSSNDRFVKISNGYYFIIVYDTQTKVEYAISNGNYNCGTVTLLVDAEGKPLLYTGEE